MSWLKKSIYLVLPVLGILFCLWYLNTATMNIVYTDYIRLVNTYLPDVFSLNKFFVPDLLTRIPINYLGRIVNVAFFSYSTVFDMVLGVLSLGLSGIAVGIYCRQQRVSMMWYFLIMLAFFNLNKWEMLTNGSGWAHFLAFAGFYYHYLVLDRVLSQREKVNDRKLLLVLPFVNTILIAGPYCAVYTVTLVCFYGYGMVRQLWQNRSTSQPAGKAFWLKAELCVLVPFLLYLWSNSYAVEDHANTYDVSMMELLRTAPGFFIRFLLKALASTVVGGETLKLWLENPDHPVTDIHLYILGAIVAFMFIAALFLIIRQQWYRENIFPLILIVSGIGNYGIVLISRYIFLDENYGMSSRYALQYQMGLIGVLLVFALTWQRSRQKTDGCKIILTVFLIFVLAGMSHTNYQELLKAPYRKASMEEKAEAALIYEELDDAELARIFEYRSRRPDSGQKVRQALSTLRENEWNVFSDKQQ